MCRRFVDIREAGKRYKHTGAAEYSGYAYLFDVLFFVGAIGATMHVARWRS